jgi:hypothetical protein
VCKIVEFTPNHVYIQYIKTRDIIDIGVLDCASHLYSFSHFIPDDDVYLVDFHTLPPRVNHVYEENFGQMNLGILETFFELPPPIPLASSYLSSSLD